MMEYKFFAVAALVLLSSGRKHVDAYSNTANHLMSRRRTLNGARFVSSIDNPAGEGMAMDEANAGLTDDQNNMIVDNLMMIGFQNTNAESCISDHSAAAAVPLLFPVPDISEDLSGTGADFFSNINENAEEAYTRELIQASVDEDNVHHQPDPPQLERQIALKPVVPDYASDDNSSGVKEILKFAVPAIGVWLCGPLLSMIDTAAVGLLSGTANQAALSPAVAVTEYSTLLLAFLYTATTNLVASAQEEEKNISGKPLTSKTLISAIQVSFFAGIGLSAALMFFSKTLLKAIIGNETISAAVFAPALRYVRIRALGLPAAAIIGTTQAACLGMKDIKAPFYVLLAAAVVNFFGDAIFVGSKSPWIGGAAGAAWATVFSQYAALAFFFKWLLYKKKADKAEGHLKVSTGDDENVDGTTETPKVVNLSKKIIESTSPGIQELNGDLKLSSAILEPASANNIIKTGRLRSIGSAKNKRKWIKSRLSSFSTMKRKRNEEKVAPEPFTTKGFLNGQLKIQDAAKVPSKVSVAEFMPYVLPVTASSVGRVSMYVAMNYVVSSTLGTSAMAAQQIILSIFYCLCPIADSLNLTAQSFIPPIYGKKKTKDRTANLQKMIKDFVKTGIIFGGVMSSMVAGIPLISGLFTTDPVVISTVNGVVPLLMGIFSLHGFVMGGEGILLGQKDLSFLGGAFSLFFALVPFLMISKKRAVGDALTLNGLWHIFAGYQIARLAIWWTRIMFLNRKMAQETANQPLQILDDYGFSEDSVGRPLNVIEGLNVDNIDTPDELLVKAPSFG